MKIVERVFERIREEVEVNKIQVMKGLLLEISYADDLVLMADTTKVACEV